VSKVDLKMLSLQLGVSVSTVSKALRDSHEIGASTKAKVLKVAQELGYKPNPYASYMRHHKSKTIALIVPEINISYFLQVIEGAESIAREKDYHLLIYITHEDAEKEISIIKHLQNGRVDGIIMAISLHIDKYDYLKECISNDIPIVFFDRICNEIETVKITTDDTASAFIATEHLIQNGCKNIGYLSISSHLSIGIKRMDGYKDALNKYDIPFDESKVIHCVNQPDEDYNLIKALLSGSTKVDGIFSSVEKFALTTYRVCKELKIQIPEQLKVVCFSNILNADLFNPSLTTLSQPAFSVGSIAASALIKHLDKKRSTISNEHIVIKSQLIVRESTAVSNKD